MSADLAALDAFAQAQAERARRRQDFAKAEAERLRKELELLRLYGGSNPKGAARRAVEIGHELAAAARDYAVQPAELVEEKATKAFDVAEALTRTADAFLRHSEGIGDGARFADKLRTLFIQAHHEVRDRRRQAEEQEAADREYDVLEWRTRLSGSTLEHGAIACASIPPVDMEG